MLRNHPFVKDHAEPRVQICDECHHALVLIDYYAKLLKGCLSCNVWGRPGGRIWMRLPSHDLRTLKGTMRSKAREAMRRQKEA